MLFLKGRVVRLVRETGMTGRPKLKEVPWKLCPGSGGCGGFESSLQILLLVTKCSCCHTEQEHTWRMEVLVHRLNEKFLLNNFISITY